MECCYPSFIFLCILSTVITYLVGAVHSDGVACYSSELNARRHVVLKSIDCPDEVDSHILIIPTQNVNIMTLLAKANELLSTRSVDNEDHNNMLSESSSSVASLFPLNGITSGVTTSKKTTHSVTQKFPLKGITSGVTTSKKTTHSVTQNITTPKLIKHKISTPKIPTSERNTPKITTPIMTVPLLPVNDSRCSEWVAYGGSRYCYMEGRETWQNATSYCRQYTQYSYLVTVESIEENTFLNDLVQERNTDGFRDTWIGLNDLEVDFEWITESGEPATFFNWETQHGDPQGNTPGESCVFMTILYDGRWLDGECGSVKHYICENRL